jgi:hypothetical protein
MTSAVALTLAAVLLGAPPQPANDGVDLVILGQRKPVRVRLRVEIDGRPVRAVWQTFLDNLFAACDRNGDGLLDPKEAALISGFVRPGFPTPNFVGLDRNRDQKLTREEFRAHADESDSFHLLAELDEGSRPGDRLGSDLAFLLDRNRDGKLSRAELGEPEKALRRLDQDDDERLTADEVADEVGPHPADFTALWRPLPRSRGILLVPGTKAGAARAPLRVWYSSDRGTLLLHERADSRPGTLGQVSAALYADGEVNWRGLHEVLQVPSSHDVRVRFDRGRGTAELVGRPGKEARLLVNATSLAPTGPAASARFHLAQFKMALRNKDALNAGEARRCMPSTPDEFDFRLADRNGDGRLTLAEAQAYFDLMTQSAGCQVVAAVRETSPDLWAILDGNGDGRLSLAELRTAGHLADTHDQNGDGMLEPGELPRRIEIGLRLGGMGLRPATPSASEETKADAPSPPQRGPVWFRKMDRNADNLLSPREFLGRPELFRRLDRDGDGFITAYEAEKADGAR